MINFPKFQADVQKALRCDYTLESGQKVKGQSLSLLQAHMRDNGWKNVSYDNIVEVLKQVGFTVSRGRMLRFYRGGKTGLGVCCDVVF
jgi:hypothetical protein